MGHKHSKSVKRLKSVPEVTEIFEFQEEEENSRNSSVLSLDHQSEVTRILTNVGMIERHIDKMTASQLNLHYMSLKDDLHNNWVRIYNVLEDHNKERKFEVIDRIKFVLQKLNDRVLLNK